MIKKGLLLFSLIFVFTASTLQEGMFLLSDLSKLELKKAGLKISTKQIYNPEGESLVNALVRVGGCTGSFVSEEGLIITNHHCAFGAVAAASTPENDYLTNGFYADTKEKEIPTSIVARITESYLDVSALALEGTAGLSAEAYSAKISSNLQAIKATESKNNPDLLIEISEMLQGKNYVLFRYKELRDIRLVYVPTRSIGEFGGETDNWVWPRHTGDFSFLRAYTSKDGSGTAFSKENIPYKPKVHLKINTKGLKENDFVFILGYPGRTYRNQPSQFLSYQNDYILPYISSWYDYQIAAMQKVAGNDKEKQLAYSSRIKSLANVTKNYKGKMQGLRRTDILDQRKAEDKAIEAMILANPKLQASYGNVLAEIEKIYADKFKTAKRDLWLGQFLSGSSVMYTGAFISYHNQASRDLNEADRKTYLKNVLAASKERFKSQANKNEEALEKLLLKKLLLDGIMLGDGLMPEVLQPFATANADAAIDKLIEEEWPKLLNYKRDLSQMLLDNADSFLLLDNRLYQIAAACNNMLLQYETEEKMRQEQLNILLPKLVELRQLYKKDQFIPDANATLRFTFGKIRSYYPSDAEKHLPFTSVKGILQKANTTDDFFLEAFIEELLKTVDPATIVCLLYDLDTTGGNSGSPIMDAYGNLVGVNFDRSFTATINDYAWNSEYSRSIGVDIRYVLFVVKHLHKADNLLKELKVG
jgi:hypothetical protein